MKEIIFLVTWTLCTILPYTPEVEYDEYGRSNSFSQTSLAIYRFTTHKVEKSKEFKTEAEADSFITRMPISNNSVMMGNQWCENPKKTKIIKEIVK